MRGKLAPSIVGVIHALVQFVHGAERVYSHRAEALPPSLARLLIHCAAPRRRPTRQTERTDADETTNSESRISPRQKV